MTTLFDPHQTFFGGVYVTVILEPNIFKFLNEQGKDNIIELGSVKTTIISEVGHETRVITNQL